MNRNGFYVYCYVDKDGTPVYIGKAVDMVRRYKEHFRAKNHEGTYGKRKCYVTELNTEGDMNLLEKYLIAKEKPIHNTSWKDKDVTLNIDISGLKWIEYNEEYFKCELNERVLSFIGGN